jgi:hypothetical protein
MKTLSQINYELTKAIIAMIDCAEDQDKCKRINLLVGSIISDCKESIFADLDKSIENFKYFLK